MHKPNLYRPPPPPPRQKEPAKDPLIALQRASIAPTMVAEPSRVEELTDLADEDLEQWALGGTRIIPKSEMTPINATVAGAPIAVAPLVQQVHPSYYPVSVPVPSGVPGKSHAGLIAVIAALAVLVMGAAIAVLALVVHRAHEVDAATFAPPPVETSAPVPQIATTSTSTSTMMVSAAPTSTSTSTNGSSTSTSTRTTARSSSTSASTITSTATPTGTGSLRTFAAGNGKPVYVDGHPVGFGGSKLTTVCGKHNVAVGIGRTKSVDIPCNGATITVGSPDGT